MEIRGLILLVIFSTEKKKLQKYIDKQGKNSNDFRSY